MSPSYTLASPAYLKIILHCAKHPHRTVNGHRLGQVDILDSVPLLHNWTSLSPMMEIGLDLATRYAESRSLHVVGYYQASERLDATALAPVGEKVASKIKSSFGDAIAFVPYIATSPTSWKPFAESGKPFLTNSAFQLISSDIVDRSISLIRTQSLQNSFGDFDDHLEDVTIDWLRNNTALPTDLK
ncbi:hypothetical protein DL96DRAFT_1612808 [Flagelloscypha sp. PMI_526]|nr:hypothetical protein DL96DRAFT_1612808 [Flagelloscypha sp. PMI_526]